MVIDQLVPHAQARSRPSDCRTDPKLWQQPLLPNRMRQRRRSGSAHHDLGGEYSRQYSTGSVAARAPVGHLLLCLYSVSGRRLGPAPFVVSLQGQPDQAIDEFR